MERETKICFDVLLLNEIMILILKIVFLFYRRSVRKLDRSWHLFLASGKGTGKHI
jgi:hypothetical protein